MQAFHLDSVDSTNQEAKRLLARGEIKGVAYVLAREQTAGKGSHGRKWASPRDAGLYLSIVQRFDEGLDPTALSIQSFTLAAGIACAEVLHAHFDVEVKLKPINDLYIGSGKLGGILVESMVEGALIRSLITGVGVNLCAADRALLKGASPAVAIEDLLGSSEEHRLSASLLATDMVTSVTSWNSVAIADGGSTILAAWERWKLPGSVSPVRF